MHFPKRPLRSFLYRAFAAAAALMITVSAPTAVYAEEERMPDDYYISSTCWPKADEIAAQAAVLMDADTGELLYVKDADSFRYPASITKILTALLVIENCDLDEELVFEGEALTQLPPGYVSVSPVEGEKMKVRDCLYGLLLPSYNDCANALAVHVSGSIKAFADLMNERAKELGCRFTHFTNPSGLAEDDHYTTAYDMALMMKECVKHPEFLEIVSTASYTIPATNKHDARYMESTDDMIKTASIYYDADVVGGKTGHTTPAGYNLIVYAERDGRHLISVVMGNVLNEQKFISTRTLLDYGFDSFHYIDAATVGLEDYEKGTGILALDEMEKSRNFNLTLKADGDMLVPADIRPEDLDMELTMLDPNEEEDGAIAEASFLLGGQKMGSGRLYLEAELLSPTIREANALYTRFENSVKLLAGLLAGGLILLTLLLVLEAKRRKKEDLTSPSVPDQAAAAFEAYVDGFDRNDPKINLKLVHTYGVMEDAQELAFRMGLSEENIELAGLIALLHDIGRFEQVRQFESFEPAVMDHAAFGVKYLFEEGHIRDFIQDPVNDAIIRTAIERHSDFALSEIPDERTLLHARLIRDADKLDNCRVKLEEDTINLVGETPEEIGSHLATKKVLNSIGHMQSVDSSDRENKLDYWISYLAYFYDINFKESFDMIAEGSFITRIIDRIPYGSDVTKKQMELIKRKLLAYMDVKRSSAKINPPEPYADELLALMEEAANIEAEEAANIEAEEASSVEESCEQTDPGEKKADAAAENTDDRSDQDLEETEKAGEDCEE